MDIKNNLKIFVDFDGTITTTDVGEEFFLKFGDPEEADKIIKRWLAYEITSTEMWRELCDTIQNFDMEEYEKFLSTIELDEAFHKFVEFCAEHDLDYMIVSDGFDFYIDRILERENLGHIKRVTNKLTLDENGKLVPSFPHTDEECSRCANCKRNQVILNSSDEDFTLYIGDGWSDTCPVQHCDYILAKNSLLKFCEKNRISYFPYNNFHNVLRRLNELVNKKRLKKRHQALLKRKEVYRRG
ncbi:MAG: MtnX-like HAD-IB family phosphatase [Rhodothermaceae bacterium]